MKELANLKKLRRIDLINTKLTDAALPTVAGFTELTWLTLDGTTVTDAGVKQLAPLKNLHTLGLGHTKVTDAGLLHVLVFTKLNTLYLAGTAITDKGVRQLAELKELRSLDLTDTKVTEKGAEELQKLMPNCQIRSGQTRPNRGFRGG
jgi:internalin A